MKTRRIMAAMLAAAASVSIAAAVSAEETPLGYVTFCADKAVLGQGLVTEPVNVPFYEGDNGIDIVQRAAEVVVVDGDWGSYIEGFADTDNGAELPAKIAEVCPDIGGRNTPGYLSSFDYTAESGWSWFLNDEYASVGIADYVPENGDVMQFRFTVYGYGCDLGVDNASGGGSGAAYGGGGASGLQPHGVPQRYDKSGNTGRIPGGAGSDGGCVPGEHGAGDCQILPAAGREDQ